MNGYVKNPLLLGPTSMVPSESTEMISKAIAVSLALRIFTWHMRVGLTSWDLQSNCNKCPCTMPNVKGSLVISTHLSTNSFSLPPTGIVLILSYGPGSRVFGSEYTGLGRPSFGGFCLLEDKPVKPNGSISESKGPYNGLGNQPPSQASPANDAPCKLSIHFMAETSILCGCGGFGRLVFCAF